MDKLQEMVSWSLDNLLSFGENLKKKLETNHSSKGPNYDRIQRGPPLGKNSDLIEFLYKSHGESYDRICDFIENKTRLKREQVAYGLIGLFGFYLIFGSLAQLFCNLIGFAYPAYASVKAIRSKSKEDDTQWLIYWTVFASFSMIDFFTETLLHYFPLYHIAKVIFLLFLYMPQTRGALYFYEMAIDPMITLIDKWINSSGVLPQSPIDQRKID